MTIETANQEKKCTTEAASLAANAAIFSEYSESLAFETLKNEEMHQSLAANTSTI
jgi:hypothetical protein